MKGALRGTCLFVLAVAKACTPGDYTGSWPNNQYCCPDGAFRSACCGEGFLDPSAAVNGILTINADVPKNAYRKCQLLTSLTVAIGPNVASVGRASFYDANLAGVDFTTSAEGLVVFYAAFQSCGSLLEVALV